MGKSFSITALAGGVGGWAARGQDAFTLNNTLIRAGAAATGQYLKDGKVNNVAGVLAAMIPAGDRIKATNWWGGDIGGFLRANKFAVTTGLELIEARLEDTTYHTLDWANVASNAMTETLTGQDATRYADGGNFNWTKLTQEALIATVGSLILNNKYGEDAGLSFLGHKLGTLTVGVIESNAEIARNLQQQATALEALAASFTQSLTERPVSAEAQRAWLNASSAGGPGAPCFFFPRGGGAPRRGGGGGLSKFVGGGFYPRGARGGAGAPPFWGGGGGIAPGGGATTGAETGSAPVIPQGVNPGAIPKDGTQIMSPDIQR